MINSKMNLKFLYIKFDDDQNFIDFDIKVYW